MDPVTGSRPVDQEMPIVDSGESVVQQYFPRGRVVRLGFGQHHCGAGPPRHLDDQGARPRGQTATTPGRHHGISDLDAALGRRSMEADVTHHLIIDDELMNPPVRLAGKISPGASNPANSMPSASKVSDSGYSGCQRRLVAADGLAQPSRAPRSAAPAGAGVDRRPGQRPCLITAGERPRILSATAESLGLLHHHRRPLAAAGAPDVLVTD